MIVNTVLPGFTVPLAEWAELVLRSDYTYRSETYFDAANTESVSQDGYGLWNAAVTLRAPSQRWALTAGVLNVADEEYRVTGVGVLDSLFAEADVLGLAIERDVRGR